MLKTSLHQFLRDERGSYTIWSLLWFMLYVAIGGLAVDVTDVYRNQSMLQATADAAALAGVMSLPDTGNVKPAALEYARANMTRAVHGYVLTADDVQIGRWDFDAEQFLVGAAPPNAVYVTTRRATENNNPLAMNFLRILQLVGLDPWWDVQAEAVAVKGVNVCHNNGIVAGGALTMTTHSDYWENICLHGVQGFKLTKDNWFQPGVTASTTCYDCLMPNEKLALSDPDFVDAWKEGGGYGVGVAPLNALKVDEYIPALIDMADDPGNNYNGSFQEFLDKNNDETTFYEGWDYLAPDGTGLPTYYSGPTLPADAVSPIGTEDPPGKFTVYHIKCNKTMGLPDGIYKDMAIVTTCPIYVNNAIMEFDNALIAVDYASDSKHGLHLAGQLDIGNGDCSAGGLELYTNASSMHFASSSDVNNVRMLSGGEVHFAAKGDGHSGIDIEAVDDVEIASQGDFGLCPNSPDRGPQTWTHSLVR